MRSFGLADLNTLSRTGAAALVGALAGQALHRLITDGEKIVGEEVLLKDLRERIRDVRQGPDGAIWLLTDDPQGRVLRLVPAS